MADVRVKICGLKRPEEVIAAAEAGAAYCGFVFFPKSPRNVTIEQAAELALAAPIGLAKVALVVDPDDALLDQITAKVPLDMIQLHGKETPERVRQVKSRYGLPVMKAVGIASEEDVENLDPYEDVADQILVDAMPATYPAVLCPVVRGKNDWNVRIQFVDETGAYVEPASVTVTILGTISI